MDFKNVFKKRGQSLIEILVSLGIGTVFLSSSIVLFNIILKTQSTLNFQQNFLSFLKDYSSMIFYSSKNQWPSLNSLERDSPYKIKFVQNVWSFEEGMEESVLSNQNYRLYFKVFDVLRDINGNISEYGEVDPSTLKIVIYFEYGPEYQNIYSFPFYITRSYLHQAFTQTDWSGGEGYPGPYYGAGNTYDESENIEPGAYE